MRSLLTVVALSCGLGACASMSEEECLVADWRLIGYQDGARGALADEVSEHRKACAPHGVVPDLDAYVSGREDGLRTYCRPNRGYAIGVEGGRYLGVCPAALEGAFVEAYNDGYGFYVRHQAISSIEHDLDVRASRIDDIAEHLIDREAALVGPDQSVEERARLVLEIKELAEERSRLRREMSDLSYDLSQAVRDLEDYERAMTQRAP